MKHGSDDMNKPFYSFATICIFGLKLKSWLDIGIYKGFPALYKQNHPMMILNLPREKEVDDMEYYFIPRNAVL